MNISLTTDKIEQGRVSGIAEIKRLYERLTGRKILLLLSLVALLVTVALIATATGAAGISVLDVCRVIAGSLSRG